MNPELDNKAQELTEKLAGLRAEAEELHLQDGKRARAWLDVLEYFDLAIRGLENLAGGAGAVMEEA